MKAPMTTSEKVWMGIHMVLFLALLISLIVCFTQLPILYPTLGAIPTGSIISIASTIFFMIWNYKNIMEISRKHNLD